MTAMVSSAEANPDRRNAIRAAKGRGVFMVRR
jgi:hypothetical protein